MAQIDERQQHNLFVRLAEARAKELQGWPHVAALLWTYETHYPEWWKGVADSKKDALAHPELQLMPSTAAQYVKVWATFKEVDIRELEKSRPRFLYQACKEVGEDREKALEAVSDAQVMSWSSFRSKWRPEKSHLLDK